MHTRPTAEIVSSLPEIPSTEDLLTLKGIGADDGEIFRYRWHSSIDGELFNGILEEVSVNPLTQGTHTITFSVKDDQGIWSDPVFRNITVHTRPTAEIISLLPEIPSAEDNLTLKGTGADDGEIFRYRWRSSIDGELFNGTLEEVSVNPLSQGTHTITFSVQDDRGVWSDEEVLVVEVAGPSETESDNSSSFIVPLIFLLAGLASLLVMVIRLPESRFRKK